MKRIRGDKWVASCLFLILLSQEINLRRIREENFLLNSFEGREIKLLVFDFDYTLALGGNPISDELLDLLHDLNRRDYKIVIITGAFLSSIRERFIIPMQQRHPDFKWENIFIATNLGSEAFKFDKKGTPRLIYKKEITDEQKNKIEEVLRKFQEEYGDQIIKKSGYDSECKFFVTFEDTEKVDEYGDFFKERLSKVNLRVTCAGRCKTLEFSPYHKGDAIDKIRKSFFPNIANEEILIVGDSFAHKYSNDRTMLINGSLIFNVGEKASDVSVIDLFNYFPQEEGLSRTAKILKTLLKSIKNGKPSDLINRRTRYPFSKLTIRLLQLIQDDSYLEDKEYGPIYAFAFMARQKGIFLIPYVISGEIVDLISPPFILYFQNKFFVVEEVGDERVEVIDENWKVKELEVGDFTEMVRGGVVLSLPMKTTRFVKKYPFLGSEDRNIGKWRVRRPFLKEGRKKPKGKIFFVYGKHGSNYDFQKIIEVMEVIINKAKKEGKEVLVIPEDIKPHPQIVNMIAEEEGIFEEHAWQVIREDIREFLERCIQ